MAGSKDENSSRCSKERRERKEQEGEDRVWRHRKRMERDRGDSKERDSHRCDSKAIEWQRVGGREKDSEWRHRHDRKKMGCEQVEQGRKDGKKKELESDDSKRKGQESERKDAKQKELKKDDDRKRKGLESEDNPEQKKHRRDGELARVVNPLPPAPVSHPPVPKESKVLKLHNIFEKCAKEDEEFYLLIKEKVHMECAKKGTPVHALHVDKSSGCLVVKFDSVAAAKQAKKILEDSSCLDKAITVTYMTRSTYIQRFGEY